MQVSKLGPKSTIDHCGSRCKGWLGPPLTHTYIQVGPECKVIPAPSEGSHHENVWGSGGTAPRIINVGTRRRWVISSTVLELCLRGKRHHFLPATRLNVPQIRSGCRGYRLTGAEWETSHMPVSDSWTSNFWCTSGCYRKKLYSMGCNKWVRPTEWKYEWNN
jgi:hypothetical protein